MHPNQPDISSDAGSRSELLLTEHTLIPMKAHGRREVMSGGGPLGLLAQELSDQPFAFLLLSLLSPHVTPSVTLSGWRKYLRALFSVSDRLRSPQQSGFIRQNGCCQSGFGRTLNPPTLSPPCQRRLFVLFALLSLKRVYRSVICGYSLAVTFDCFDFRKKIRRGPCFRVGGWE